VVDVGNEIFAAKREYTIFGATGSGEIHYSPYRKITRSLSLSLSKNKIETKEKVTTSHVITSKALPILLVYVMS
jgi:hypothetical protein